MADIELDMSKTPTIYIKSKPTGKSHAVAYINIEVTVKTVTGTMQRNSGFAGLNKRDIAPLIDALVTLAPPEYQKAFGYIEKGRKK